MIFDTNVLIDVSKSLLKITDLIPPNTKCGISVISYIEAMGFAFETDADQYYMDQICSSFPIIHLSDLIIKETIFLRKNHRIKLPDAIIYATAVIEGSALLTHNTIDFKLLNRNVRIVDPYTI